LRPARNLSVLEIDVAVLIEVEVAPDRVITEVGPRPEFEGVAVNVVGPSNAGLDVHLGHVHADFPSKDGGFDLVAQWRTVFDVPLPARQRSPCQASRA